MGHGDASGAEGDRQTGGAVPGACVRPVCPAHGVHPPGHGRPLGLPPRPPPPLVSLSSVQSPAQTMV